MKQRKQAAAYPQQVCQATKRKPFKALQNKLPVPEPPFLQKRILRPGPDRNLQRAFIDVCEARLAEQFTAGLADAKRLTCCSTQLFEYPSPPFHGTPGPERIVV